MSVLRDSSNFLSKEVWYIADTMPGGITGVSLIWELVKRIYITRGSEAVVQLRTAFAALATYMTGIMESIAPLAETYQLSPKVDTFIQSILNNESLCYTEGNNVQPLPSLFSKFKPIKEHKKTIMPVLYIDVLALTNAVSDAGEDVLSLILLRFLEKTFSRLYTTVIDYYLKYTINRTQDMFPSYVAIAVDFTRAEKLLTRETFAAHHIIKEFLTNVCPIMIGALVVIGDTLTIDQKEACVPPTAANTVMRFITCSRKDQYLSPLLCPPYKCGGFYDQNLLRTACDFGHSTLKSHVLESPFERDFFWEKWGEIAEYYKSCNPAEDKPGHEKTLSDDPVDLANLDEIIDNISVESFERYWKLRNLKRDKPKVLASRPPTHKWNGTNDTITSEVKLCFWKGRGYSSLVRQVQKI